MTIFRSILLQCVFLFILLFAAAGCREPKKEQPNILLILADDLGYEKLGCYGNIDNLTPNLDRMAEEGFKFTKAYTSPICTPSRMSLYTGTYVPTHGYVTVIPIPQGTKEKVDFEKWTTYAQLFRDQGYSTSVTGKWQLAALEMYPDHCREAGFDSWCVWQIMKNGNKTKRYWNPTFNQDGKIRTDIDSLFGPDVLTDYVIEQMEKAEEEDKPFMIHHNMVLPHFPIVQTPLDKSEDISASLDNMINYLDVQVGILMDAVRLNPDIADSTWVFFIGDNGTDTDEPRMTEYGIVTGGKAELNDAGIHVPFIAWSPGIDGGKTFNGLIDMADVFPTICELSGIEIPAGVKLDGVSFAQMLTESAESKREYVTAGIFDDFAVFDGEWRLHKKENKLIDCRNLPVELNADMESEDAQQALNRLQPVLNNLIKIESN